MFSVNFNNIVNKLHITDLIKYFKECLKDNKGGFLIPTSSKITDTEYAKYKHLPINWAISPVTKDDLPDDFSPLL